MSDLKEFNEEIAKNFPGEEAGVWNITKCYAGDTYSVLKQDNNYELKFGPLHIYPENGIYMIKIEGTKTALQLALNDLKSYIGWVVGNRIPSKPNHDE